MSVSFSVRLKIVWRPDGIEYWPRDDGSDERPMFLAMFLAIFLRVSGTLAPVPRSLAITPHLQNGECVMATMNKFPPDVPKDWDEARDDVEDRDERPEGQGRRHGGKGDARPSRKAIRGRRMP